MSRARNERFMREKAHREAVARHNYAQAKLESGEVPSVLFEEQRVEAISVRDGRVRINTGGAVFWVSADGTTDPRGIEKVTR